MSRRREYAVLVRKEQDELFAAVEAAAANAMRNLEAASLAGLDTMLAAASWSADDLAIIEALWPEMVDRNLMPVVTRGWELSTARTSKLLRRRLRAAVARYGQAEIDRIILSARDAFLAAARLSMLNVGTDAMAAARVQLLEGVALGESIPKLSARIRGAIGGSEWEATRAARTNVIAASNAGALAQARAMGAEGIQDKGWLATNDNRTREWHADADGQWVGINEPFSVGGELLDYPGDGSTMNAANCRCTVIWRDIEEGAGSLYDDVGNLDDEFDADGVAASAQGAAVDPDEIETPAEAPVEPDAPVELTAAQRAIIERPYEWHSVSMLEDVETGDGRLFEAGSISWRQPPFSLEWNPVDGGHVEATLMGAVTKAERIGNRIETWGVFARGDDGVHLPLAQEAISQIRNGSLSRVSAEWDETKDADVELVWPDEVPEDEQMFAMPELVVFHKARMSALVLVDMPAWQETFIELVGALADDQQEEDMGDPVLAAAYSLTIPDVPPRAWFEKPSPDEMRVGALTITDEGRVYGLLAPGNVFHQGRADKLTVPLGVDYSTFLRGETPVADGGRVVTGNLTMECGHASITSPLKAAADHYDNSCSVFATVTVGEHRGDVWIAGALMPDVTPAQVRRAMALQLSGDWRGRDDGKRGRRLAAALLVPVPGFPMQRAHPTTRMATEDGSLQLVASAVPVRFEAKAAASPPVSQVVVDSIARSIERDHTARARVIAKTVRGR